MKKEDSISMEHMLLEISASDDVRKLIDLLQDHVDAEKEKGNNATCIAERAGMDPSFLSRIINGRNGNPNILTIAKIFRAMNKRVEFLVVDINGIQPVCSNYYKSADFDAAKFAKQFKSGGTWKPTNVVGVVADVFHSKSKVSHLHQKTNQRLVSNGTN